VAAESLVFCWLTVVASLALWPAALSPLYGACALVLGGMLLMEGHRLHRRAVRGESLRPMRLFHWSTTYLTLLFLGIAVDTLIAG
jgi:protoheme IX farnesyltransferase